MEEQRKRFQTIGEYLRLRDTQEKIRRKIIESRSAATVTITRAASLFNFTDNQLREWDRLGYVKPLRPENAEQDGRKHRQYTASELDLLATFRVLMDNKYTISDIKQHLPAITDVADQLGQQIFAPPGAGERQALSGETGQKTPVQPIDQLLDNADNELFWRYYANNALRLSLSLLAEYNPNTIIGLVMPLGANVPSSVSPATIADLGECLIGWLRPNFSFYTLYTPKPGFEHESDFRMRRLQVIKGGVTQEDAEPDSTWIVVQRRAGVLNISADVLATIRRLLAPLYEQKNEWLPLFTGGQRSFSFPVADFVPGPADDPTRRSYLTRLANLIVSMGCDKSWKFAVILEPHNSRLPVAEHKLIVRAASEEAPQAYKDKEVRTIVEPTDKVISVSMRAYQGGSICYRHHATSQDESIFNYNLEQPIGSCIAVPIGGEEAKPLGVMYIASNKHDAFNEDDQRLLRMIARMVQEVLLMFQARIKVTEQLKPLTENPALADVAFKVFPSETDFITDAERLLKDILARDDLKKLLEDMKGQLNHDELPDIQEPNYEKELGRLLRPAMKDYYNTNDVLTFCCFDINEQTRLTQKYGETLARNLSREVGIRARNKLATLFMIRDVKLYHAYGDRFYVYLGGIPLEEVRTKMLSLKDELDGTYKVNALRFSTDQRTPEEMLVQENITVRTGASCYPAIKAFELMQRPSSRSYPVEAVVNFIRIEFDKILRLGPGCWCWDLEKWEWTESKEEIYRMQ